ncbi:MAG: caspase family protein [Leptospiraceae bacterium]|nr:caspase family protein [Leptospiraceae bacterium]
MDWKGNQRKQRSHYRITFLALIFLSFSFLSAKEEFVLIVGKNYYEKAPNIFGNLDSYRIYLSLKENKAFSEVVLLNEVESPKPNKNNFLTEIQRLLKNYNKGLIYISLNGYIDKTGLPILIFENGEVLHLEEILKLNIPLDKQIIFFLDLCKFRTTQIYERSNQEDKLELAEVPKQFAIFLSSNEEGYCYYEPKKAGSFFTNRILELLGNKNFLNLEKFSKELQAKWTEAQKNLKEEKRNSYFTWNTKQKQKILSSPISEPQVRTIQYYDKFQPFSSSILYNLAGERFYEVYFLNLQPFSFERVNQAKHEISSTAVKNFFFDEKGKLLHTLGFWNTQENQFELHHVFGNELAKTSYEVSSSTVQMKRENHSGKNLLKDGIDWIEYRFSRGLLILKLYKNHLKILVQDKLGISATRYNYDEQGNLLQEEFFDSNKKLVENSEKIAKYFYEYGTSGNLEKIRKYSKQETYVKHTPPITLQKFNDANQILSIEYLNHEERPIQNEEGIQKIEYLYENNLPKEIIYFSDFQKQKRFGYSNIKFDYNSKGKLLQKTYYSFLKQRTLDENGISIYKYSYDDANRLSSVSFFDEEENPASNTEDYHKIVYIYDGQKLIQEKFYDKNENLIQKPEKPAYVLYLYDKTNKLIGFEKYNFHNQLLEAKFNLELENSLNSACDCKISLKLDKFYRVNELDFFDSKNFVGGKE